MDPLVKGGQGRSEEGVSSSACIIGIAVLVLLMIALVALSGCNALPPREQDIKMKSCKPTSCKPTSCKPSSSERVQPKLTIRTFAGKESPFAEIKSEEVVKDKNWDSQNNEQRTGDHYKKDESKKGAPTVDDNK